VPIGKSKPSRVRDDHVIEALAPLCLAKSRNEDRTLHFEASGARVSPRLHPTSALKIADIGGQGTPARSPARACQPSPYPWRCSRDRGQPK